jgi:TolA-binding protein
LPAWALIGGWAVVILALAALFATGSDWAAGAQHAGIAAAAVAVLVLVALVVRGVAGLFAATNVRRAAQVTGASVAAALLLLVGAGGIGLQAPIHRAQASVLEGQQQWQTALNEYSLAGATAPNSEDLARTYNEWGEALTTSGQYQTAITKFDYVITTFTGAPVGLARANKDDATAYYHLGEKDLSANDNQGAVAAFQTLTSRFPHAPEVAKAHADYAKALLAVGEAEVTGGECDSALTTYTTLQQQFSDTSQGTQAATALKAPQAVMGKFTGKVAPPSGQIAAVIFGTNVKVNPTSGTVSGDFPYAALINKDGTFQSDPIPLGTYAFGLAFVTTGTTQSATVYVLVDASNQPVTFTMKPLCPTDLGSLNLNVTNPPSSLPAKIQFDTRFMSIAWNHLDRNVYLVG